MKILAKLFGNKKEMETNRKYIEIQCNSCFNSLKIGIDASVLTMSIMDEGSSEDLNNPIVNQFRQSMILKGNPDSIDNGWYPEEKLYKKEFMKVLNSLEKNEKRIWRCNKCGMIQFYVTDAIKFK